MSVISQATRIAKEEKRIAAKRWKELSKPAPKMKKSPLVLAIRKILKSIDGKRGFRVEFKDPSDGSGLGIFGEIGSIHHKDSYVGTVCKQRHTYMWRGSDESPEQECESTSLEFKHIVNEESSMWSFELKSDNGSEAVKAFETWLPSHLAKLL